MRHLGSTLTVWLPKGQHSRAGEHHSSGGRGGGRGVSLLRCWGGSAGEHVFGLIYRGVIASLWGLEGGNTCWTKPVEGRRNSWICQQTNVLSSSLSFNFTDILIWKAIQIKFSCRKRSLIPNQWPLHSFPWELSCPCEGGSWGATPRGIDLRAEGTGDVKCLFWTLRWKEPLYNRPALSSNSTKQQLLAWLTFRRAGGG